MKNGKSVLGYAGVLVFGVFFLFLVMSWLPIYKSWVVLLFILSVFLWKLEWLVWFVLVGVVSLVFLIKESLLLVKHYAYGFWLFILSEVMAFGTLLYLCLNYGEVGVLPISEFSELPLLGCFILLGSSITVTAYHHFLGSAWCHIFLFLTILLGFCFVVLQLFEFYDCECDMTFSVYQACCFGTVGLHFTHVVGGLLCLSCLLLFGEGSVSDSNIDFVVWYWHFVDYIWLFVYLIVYVV